MCGIIGMAGSLEYRDKDVIRDLLHFCELRGEDSTGFFTVAKDNDEAPIHKVVGPTRNMFDTMAFDKLSLFNKRAFIGHCRKATVGAVAKRTAHPFNYNQITGVHNGTLRNWRALPGASEETDSMTLFDNFANVGVKDTIEALDGAYALIWWDEAQQELNVLRNKERPLFYAFSEKGDKIIWASEQWMIHVACSRNGFKLMDLTPKSELFTSVESVPEDQWWRIKLGRVGQKPLTFLGQSDGHDETLKGGTKKAVAQSSAPFRYRTPFGWEGDLDDDPNVDVKDQPRLAGPTAHGQTSTVAASRTTSSSSTSSSATATTPSSTSSQPLRPTLSLVRTDSGGSSSSSKAGDLLVGYKGLLLSQPEFNELVDCNCVWCKTTYSYDDLRDGGHLGEWIDEDEFICNECFRACRSEGIC